MFVKRAMQFAILTAALLWESRSEAAAKASVKFCGRQLSEIMSRVCHAYNGPSWDVPTVVEQPGTVVRKKRQLGIADECCIIGCTWEQLSEYCSISAYSESPLEDLEAHIISDRSAEQEAEAMGGLRTTTTTKSVLSVVTSGGGAAGAKGARRENLLRSAARAAPVVGTVSPLITWGRTLNTDVPITSRDRYAYIVYA